MSPFSDQELQSLADEINLQLNELATGIDDQNLQKSFRGGKKTLPGKQKSPVGISDRRSGGIFP